MRVNILLLAVAALTGCNFIYSTVTGIKDSRVETPEFQREYLSKNRIDTNYMAVLKKHYLDSLSHSKYSLDTFKNMGFTPIQFRVYDRNGELYTGWEICLGSAEKMNLYAAFPQKAPKRLPINYRINLENDLNYVQPLNFNKQNLFDEIKKGEYDYVVISLWAGYLGKFSRRMLEQIDAAIAGNKHERIIHIKVNLGNDS
jgi:hypothetical protein